MTATVVEYGLIGVSNSLQFGKDNGRIVFTNTGFLIRNRTNTDFDNISIAYPTVAEHAATKLYVDTLVENLQPTIPLGTTLQYYRGDKTFQTLDTLAVPENTNLYFTNVRARASLSSVAPILYDSGTGAITIQQATGSQSGYLTSTDWNTFNDKQPALGFTPENVANKNQPNGYAGLDSGGKIPASLLISNLLLLKGSWDASTNTPTLVDGVGTAGWVYECTVAGTVDFGNGNISFDIGDWAIYGDNNQWYKSLNTNKVTSVNGQTGTVVLTTNNISENTNLYFTTQRARDSFSAGSNITILNGVISAASSLPTGGTTGQVLVKNSNTDYDAGWVDSSTFGGTYNGASPTTVTVGGLIANSAISGQSVNSILEQILVPYLAPAFASFSMSGQSTSIEVGATVSGSKSFTFTFSNSGNVQANTLSIIDVTGSSTLVSGQPITSPQSANIGSVTLSSPGSYSWKGQATSTRSVVFNSSNFTVSWFWRLFTGTSSNVILNSSQIQALGTSSLASSRNGTYSFAAGNYKYFAWPDTFGSPTTATGFRDTSTNLSVSMADSSDNAAYSNTQNGWSYALVSVTNINSVATNYRVYRTKNMLSGSINIQVS